MPRASREPLTLSTLLEDNGGRRPESTGAFPLGMTIDGRVYWADLAEPTMTSILIGGTSGSGKSVLLQSIVAGLGLCAPPGSVRFVLIDPKRVTFPHFADLPCVENPLYLDAEPALKRLSGLVDEMEERYRVLEEGAVPDLRAYNDHVDEPLFRYVVIIDEYADMILDHDTRSDLDTCIQRIGQKGRTAGFHLVLATQRPDSKVVTGVIKANLQLKIALKVTNAANSRIILDEPGAEYLIGHGDMLVGGSTAVERLQGALVTKTELQQLSRC
ncbi:MAG: FtsK/SpoIIIE domain-containing protein [Pirellulaceae bacterium]